MATCWKCGKELKEQYFISPCKCPECETLDLLKKMHEEKMEERKKERRAEAWDNGPHVFEPTDRLSPAWWKEARDPKSSGVVAILALLMGEWGIPFMYIGKSWTILGVGMFIIYVSLLILHPFASVIYMMFTNFVIAGWFLVMNEDDFLKRFRYDQWIDKQIADQYGHETDEYGNYIGIPLQKPSWEEAFSAKQKEPTQEEQRTSGAPSDDGTSKPKMQMRVKIVK